MRAKGRLENSLRMYNEVQMGSIIIQVNLLSIEKYLILDI